MRRRWAALPAALGLLAVGCGYGPPERTVTVFAASSLSAALPEIARAFEDAHSGVRVRLSFAGSQSLVAQVAQGAPADVLATADEPSMAQVATADRPRVFARNALAVIAPAGQPVPTLAALARPDLKVVLGGPTVPVGRAARQLLTAAGVTVRPVSEEPDVRSVLAKVVAGEADAAIVYATDLAAAGASVAGKVLAGIVTSLPIVALTTSDAAAAFVDLVLSEQGRAVLVRHGFSPP